MGKPKKGGKKKDKDDWEDDVLNDLEAMKEGGDDVNEHSVKPSYKPKNSAAVNKFNLLVEDDEPVEEEEKTSVLSQKTKKKAKKNNDDDGVIGEREAIANNGTHETNSASSPKSKQDNDDNELDIAKSSKKVKKRKKNKEIDIDDLAMDEDELQSNTLEAESNISKSSKEHKATKTENIIENEDESGPTVKTAAQKRAEKKEREKKKKEAEKAKVKAKAKKLEGAKETEEKEEENVLIHQEPVPSAEVTDANSQADENKGEKNDVAEVQEEGEGDEDGEGESDKKKKKKKKKKAVEKEEKKTKKPNKALVKQMQQQLEQMKLEEERLKREEEERQRALEEAENRRLEKLRLEQERKEKKKQKEKERRERLKKEGKLLTKAQKQQRAQQQAQLEALKQQGIEIPALTRVQTEQVSAPVKKPVRYGSKKPKQKQQQQVEQKQQSAEQQESEVSAVAEKEEPVVADETVEEEQNKEEVDAESKEEVKDAWDIESDDEEKMSTDAAPKRQLSKEHLESKGEDGDEESEESESEESEEESESSEEDDEDEDDESDEDETKTAVEHKKETVEERVQRRRTEADALRSTDVLRSPVVCVLGHVDTGKTKILDKIRHSHVQDGEAGGITQQIGATMVPVYAIREQTKMVKEFADFDIKLPGLLIIDTPGHESFSNLRSRGSSLCDMAILVVDIMHGLEPQTIESINLLKKRKTPFIVALNKVDRLFEWKRGPNSCIVDTVKKQKKNTKQEFDERVQIVINEFAEQGLNATLFYNNKDTRSYVSLVPTSAHTGDGMGDLISQIVTLTQGRMANKLSFSQDLDCMVLEVKALPGLGTTIDVILVNGTLREGDTIVLAGIEGPIVTQVRALLMPQPLKELRVKNQYVTHKEIVGAQGVKIAAKELEKALAGISLYVAQQADEVEYFKEEVASALSSTLKAIQLSERGVYVQASTLGSLEALLEFLRTSKIPYAGVNIGPVHRKDIMKCSIMLEHDSQYAVVLAFDVRVERDAQEMADQMGVKIFAADIIYHLFDKFTAYREELKMKKREEFRNIAVFPCKLRILPQHIFNSRDPIVVGVVVEGGIVKEGTPIVVPSKNFIDVGVVTGIEANHKSLESARKGMEVCIKIEPTPGDTPKLYGRHFDHTDLLVSKISRQSIDAVKDYFREDMQKSDWQLMIELKKLFEIL